LDLDHEQLASECISILNGSVQIVKRKNRAARMSADLMIGFCFDPLRRQRIGPE
jgi:hypothetical protein